MSNDDIAFREERPSSFRSPLIRPERYGLFDKLLFAVFVLLLPPFLASKPGLFADGDVSWHVAAGRWMIDHGRVPSTDPFSFTMYGQPWIAHEWLSEVIYAGAFNAAAFAGLAAVVTFALMALHCVVFLHLRTRVGPIAVLLTFLGLDLVLSKFIIARPHVLVWPLLAIWTAVLVTCRQQRRLPPMPLVLIVTLWTNLHGSFPLAWIVVASIALDAVMAARWERRVLLHWLAFGALSVLAVLLNANGLTQLTLPLNIIGMKSVILIQEWNASSPALTPLFYLVLIATLALVLIRGVKLRLGETLLLVFLLGWAFSQVRHQSWLAIVASIVLTPYAAGAFRAYPAPISTYVGARRLWLSGTAAVAVGVLLARLWIPLEPKHSITTPQRLLARVPPALERQAVFNEYSFGGPLILAGAKPYIDGRADMYGDKFVMDWWDMANGDMPKFEAAVRKYGIRWTILTPNLPLVKALDKSPRWRRYYSDEIGVIHVRR